MEIMIQTKRFTFSLGSKGYRKVTHAQWDKVRETFEILTLSQTGKMKDKSAELKAEERKLRSEVEGRVLGGPTASQLNRLSVNEEIY